jgi:hypothetical protein
VLREDVEEVIMLWTPLTVSLEQPDRLAMTGDKAAIVTHRCKDDPQERPPSLSDAARQWHACAAELMRLYKKRRRMSTGHIR